MVGMFGVPEGPQGEAASWEEALLGQVPHRCSVCLGLAAWGGFGDLIMLLPQCLLPVPSPPQCMLIFIIGGLVILAYCSQASNERTYQEVVWAVCGKVPGVLCEVAIAVYTFGTCIAFLIIIGDQEDKSKCVPWKKIYSCCPFGWKATI